MPHLEFNSHIAYERDPRFDGPPDYLYWRGTGEQLCSGSVSGPMPFYGRFDQGRKRRRHVYGHCVCADARLYLQLYGEYLCFDTP